MTRIGENILKSVIFRAWPESPFKCCKCSEVQFYIHIFNFQNAKLCRNFMWAICVCIKVDEICNIRGRKNANLADDAKKCKMAMECFSNICPQTALGF